MLEQAHAISPLQESENIIERLHSRHGILGRHVAALLGFLHRLDALGHVISGVVLIALIAPPLAAAMAKAAASTLPSSSRMPAMSKSPNAKDTRSASRIGSVTESASCLDGTPPVP